MIEIVVLLALVASNIMLWRRVRRLEERLIPAPRLLPVEIEPSAPPSVPESRPTVVTRVAAMKTATREVLARAKPVAPPAASPRLLPTRGGFETLFGSTLPIWAGGITLAVAGLFIVKYSIDTGLLSPAVRVVLALAFAAALVAGAEGSRRWRATAIDPRVAQALAGAGIAVAYAAILLAANAYALIGAVTAFVALAGVTAAALALALRFGAPSAVLGLVGGLAAPMLADATGNVATLAIYLGLAIVGLAGVARTQGWRWLSAAALVGGFGWGGVMLARPALGLAPVDVVTALSIGGYLLLLALAVPFVAGGFVTGRAVPQLMRLLPPAAAAVQLAILIGLGGYRPLVWGLYALLGFGVIVLARIDRRVAALPPLALAIGAIVVALWVAPPAALLVAVLIVGVVLFGGDAALRLVRGGGESDALQLGGALTAALALGTSKHPQFGDALWGIVALLAAAPPLWLAWRRWQRRTPTDLVTDILAATALVLLDAGAVLLVAPAWLPAVMAALAVGAAWVARRYEDAAVATVARVALVAAGLALFADGSWSSELARLAGDMGGSVSPASALRFALVAGAVAAFAALDRPARAAAQFAAALLAALAIAQVVPSPWIAPAVAVAAVALVEAARVRRADVLPGIGGLALVVLGWAVRPFDLIATGALGALAGVPLVPAALPPPIDALLLLVAPAVLLGVALVRGAAVADRMRKGATIALAVIGGAGLLVLYKQVFAIDAGAGFVARGMAERVVLTTILYALAACAWWAMRRDQRWAKWLKPFALYITLLALARTLGFDGLIYNPLGRAQSVGALPIVNLLAPAYLLPLVWLGWAKRNDARFVAERVALVEIMLVLAYAAAGVRQVFHGSIIAGVPLPQGENIAVSLVAIAVAVGFLVWGIRVKLRAWRIASLVLMLGALGKVFISDASGLEGLARIGSFVALGFSLIGIGWLYSRYLSVEKPVAAETKALGT